MRVKKYFILILFVAIILALKPIGLDRDSLAYFSAYQYAIAVTDNVWIELHSDANLPGDMAWGAQIRINNSCGPFQNGSIFEFFIFFFFQEVSPIKKQKWTDSSS